MADSAAHFAAFSFVDRITEFEPGAARARAFAVPARHRGVSRLPRRRGGRAARRVGRDGAHRLSRPARRGARQRDALPAPTSRPASTLDARRRDRAAATTRRSPTPAGRRSTARGSIELIDCLGPMLPVAEFDAPAALAARFALLRGAGAPPGRFRGVAPRVDRAAASPATSRAPRRCAVPASAPFFADHFPRRPVFPATLLLDAQIGLALELARRAAGLAARRDAAPVARMTHVKVRSFTPPGATARARGDAAGHADATRDVRARGRTPTARRRDRARRNRRRRPRSMNAPTPGKRRVAITGIGLVTPVGNDVATTWERAARRPQRRRPDQPLRRAAASRCASPPR